jgi:hypothetical protein
MARTMTLLDEISRMKPPEPIPDRNRPSAVRSQIFLKRKIQYPGATLHQVAADVYETTVGARLWTIEKAKIEIRLTGRRVRQFARYLIGYMVNVKTVVFLEFLPLPNGINDIEALHFWLDHLASHLSASFLKSVFEVVEYSLNALHQPAQILPA